jgi:hypothetical protein
MMARKAFRLGWIPRQMPVQPPSPPQPQQGQTTVMLEPLAQERMAQDRPEAGTDG